MGSSQILLPTHGGYITAKQGSGCDTVGNAVASNTRGRGFESIHKQYLLLNYRKAKNEDENEPFFEKTAQQYKLARVCTNYEAMLYG